jgi:hypothetical protein
VFIPGQECERLSVMVEPMNGNVIMVWAGRRDARCVRVMISIEHHKAEAHCIAAAFAMETDDSGGQ